MECGGQSQPVFRKRSTLSNYMEGEDVGYVWDWGPDGRDGSWAPDGRATKLNRYKIDFQAWEQVNIDTDRRRTVRLSWVTEGHADPKWDGQIPKKSRCG